MYGVGAGPVASAMLGILLAVLLLALLLLLWRSTWRPRSLPGVTVGRQGEPLLLGHRGVRGARPENTLAAFRLAFESGLDGIEFDVQRSADGVLVVTHDSVVDGMDVASLGFAELSGRIEGLPRLEEVFELARGYPGRLLNLEVKTERARNHGLERQVAAAVRASGLADRVLVSSFNPLALGRVRLAAPELRTALLFAPDMPAWLRSGRLAGWLHVDAIHPHHSGVTASGMRRARARGLQVNTWTVNDAREVKRVTALGVDGIIADDPVALKVASDGRHAGR